MIRPSSATRQTIQRLPAVFIPPGLALSSPTQSAKAASRRRRARSTQRLPRKRAPYQGSRSRPLVPHLLLSLQPPPLAATLNHFTHTAMRTHHVLNIPARTCQPPLIVAEAPSGCVRTQPIPRSSDLFAIENGCRHSSFFFIDEYHHTPPSKKPSIN